MKKIQQYVQVLNIVAVLYSLKRHSGKSINSFLRPLNFDSAIYLMHIVVRFAIFFFNLWFFIHAVF